MPPAPQASRNPTLAFVAPFAVYVAAMAIERSLGLAPEVFYPIRFVLVALTIVIFSRHYLTFRPSYPVASIAIGIAVFLIWIGPDVLFHYRGHWLFTNSVMGAPSSSATPALKHNLLFIGARVASTALLVPILEELFWRGWLMRWLIAKDFLKVELGTYEVSAFWIVAILFASEHGSYWEVGLAAGIIYNWWIVRTRNLADCMLAHGVTNGALAAYVLLADQWQYWF